jgi:hypothetical protein
MRLYVDNNDITFGVESNIWRAFDKSIENNSKETFNVLKSFVRRILQLSIKERSLKHFQQYIFFPATFYSLSYEKKLHDPSLEQLHKICSEHAALHLKEIIWFDIGFRAKGLNEISERKIINQFYYWAFNGFSRLLYYMVKNGDQKQFKNALEEYEQISDTISGQNYDMKFKLKELQRDNVDGKRNEEIKALKEELTVSSQFETYRRHVLLGIKYWILFLYRINRLSEESTLAFVDLIKVHYFDSDEVLDDILFFRDRGSHWYLEWSEWDYTERRSGKVYSPPSPHDWLTLGFMADQLRENRLRVNLEERSSEELTHVRFLHDSLKEYAGYFQESFDKWKGILGVQTIEQLKEKSDQILSLFAMLKRKSIGDVEKAIAAAPLSQNKIDNYREALGKAWKSQARINRLFKRIGTTELVTDNEIKLKHIGQRTFFEKAKMMFIEGEHYQMIYGVDRMGGEIGRWEDTEFFSTIIRSEHNKVTGTSALEVLNKAIAHLKSKEVIPDLILLSPEYSYKDKALLESKLFVSKINEPVEENEISFYHLGTFDGIPIYTSFSEFLKNRVLVCEFKKAFKMRYKTNPTWYENELTVDVKEVTDEEAKRRLEEQPDKWKKTEDGIELSDEDALTLVKTSVIIDHWSTLDFQIEDKESFVMGYIKTESKTE